MIDQGGPGSFLLPMGTVAFLLTDIEQSTRRWESEPEAMVEAMAHHDRILASAITAHRGVGPRQGEGDSMVGAFSRVSDAVMAALDAQKALQQQLWPTAEPLRVRMAVHTGETRVAEDGNYAGQAIIRTARLRALAHGGQVLVTAAARDLTVDELGDAVSFRDLGRHRLRDLTRPERVYQLCDPSLPADFPPLQSLDSHPHNLPLELSTFVGRAEETASVSSLLSAYRLVTITGSGGAGKSRLALQVAAEVVDQWPDGVWWIELADLADPEGLAAAIASAVGVKGDVGENAIVRLAEVLTNRRMLIVLDNCEHLVDGVARDVDRLLRACPGLGVLTTSREPLDVAGEVAWRIPSLETVDGVLLFVDRAQKVRSNFGIDDRNAPVISEVCRRLDGIPLAIELAAARVRAMSVSQILGGLEDALSLLSGGRRVQRRRQQTLEASIQWSHDLLSLDEQVLLRRLAVFSGGCTLGDAEAVVADETVPAPAVLALIDRLVTQSLVILDDRFTTPRYRILETMRQYANRQLDHAGERSALRARHSEHFARMARQLGPQLEGREEQIPLARLVDEYENIRGAIDESAAADRWPDLVGVCCALTHLWSIVAPAEGLARLTAVLEHIDVADNANRARVFLARAFVQQQGGGDFIAALFDAQNSLGNADAAGDEATAGRSQALMAAAVAFVDLASAEAGFERAIDRCRRAGDQYGELWARTWRSVGLAIHGDTQWGWQAHAETAPLVAAWGNHMLTAVHASAAAFGHLYMGDAAAVETDITAIESALTSIVRAAGIDPDLLQRRSVPGMAATYASGYVTAAHGGDVIAEIERGDRIVAMARAEGFLFAELTLAQLTASHAVSAYSPDVAIGRTDAVRERARELGMQPVWVMASYLQATARLAMGDFASTAALLDEIDASAPALMPYPQQVRLKHRRAALQCAQSDLKAAEALVHEALALAERYTYRWEIAICLELLAAIAAACDSATEAARLLGAATRFRHDFRNQIQFPADEQRVEIARSAACEALGREGFDAAFAEGYAFSLDEAVQYARRSRGERKRPGFGWDSLTPTECQVVELVQAGLTNPQIAARLLMSRETVKTHLRHVYSKLGLNTRSALAATAAQRPTR